jgi:hypothetical protein
VNVSLLPFGTYVVHNQQAVTFREYIDTRSSVCATDHSSYSDSGHTNFSPLTARMYERAPHQGTDPVVPQLLDADMQRIRRPLDFHVHTTAVPVLTFHH